MITYLALSPHPPLIIPAIGGDRLKEVDKTVIGMQQMAKAVVESQPEAIVFLTPHGNVFSDCITCLGSATLKGNFSRFGYHDIIYSRSNDLTFIKEIISMANDRDINFIKIDEKIARRNRLNTNLDHGILVPLHYLQIAGLADNIPIIPISIGQLPNLTLYEFGQILQLVAEKLERKVAVIASGDMSHRLKDEGPYDYHPDGSTFDNLIKNYLATGDVEAIINLPSNLRENAGECAYPSILIMLGSIDSYDIKSTIFSYEGPFGVGYLTAGFELGNKKESYLEILKNKKAQAITAKRENETIPVKWARLVLENYIKNGTKPTLPKDYQELAGEKGAVFVTLKKDGQLRGCIGTILPVYDNLAEELANNAVSAGTRDPRFLPVKIDELPDLTYSVDILELPEVCTRAELNPNEYGVIVSKGSRRGLLLPQLEGVDTIEKQISIALDKAGISHHEDYKIERFKVTRYY